MPMYLPPIKCKHFSHTCFIAVVCKETNYPSKCEVPSFTFPSLTLLSATPQDTTVMYWQLHNPVFYTFKFYYTYETCLLHTWAKLFAYFSSTYFFFTLGVGCGTLVIATFTTKHSVFRTCYGTLVHLFKLRILLHLWNYHYWSIPTLIGIWIDSIVLPKQVILK